jgi:ribosomal protein S18 acetylase RimI-like enzyme
MFNEIQNNLVHFYNFLSKSKHTTIRIDDNITYYALGFSSPFLNIALCDLKKIKDIDTAIQDIKNFFKNIKTNKFTFVSCDYQYDKHVKDKLLENGFTYDEGSIGMAYDLNSFTDNEQSDIKVTHVASKLKLIDWAQTSMSGYGLAYSYSETCYDIFEDKIADTNNIFLLATVNNEPAATGLLMLQGDIAGIYWIATKPEFRKKELATALTLEMLHRAKDAGCKHAVLQSTTMALNLYKRLGFKEYFRMSGFLFEFLH